MAEQDIQLSASPEDRTPAPIYIAVGRAIHAWEGLEQAFARLYLKLRGQPEGIGGLVDYGARYRRFTDRKIAVASAAELFFVGHPCQDKEGTLADLLNQAELLSIERHRIAHGQVIQAGKSQQPFAGDVKDVIISMRTIWRWSAPWYSLKSLRTDM